MNAEFLRIEQTMGASWLEPLTLTVTVFPFKAAHWPCNPWAVFVYEHFCGPVGWLTIFPPRLR